MVSKEKRKNVTKHKRLHPVVLEKKSLLFPWNLFFPSEHGQWVNLIFSPPVLSSRDELETRSVFESFRFRHCT